MVPNALLIGSKPAFVKIRINGIKMLILRSQKVISIVLEVGLILINF